MYTYYTLPSIIASKLFSDDFTHPLPLFHMTKYRSHMHQSIHIAMMFCIDMNK